MSIECAFLGALGRDAGLKTSQSDKSYLRLSVRVGNDDGAQWVSVLCFDAGAIEVADKLVRGARVYCEGKLSLNEWTNAHHVVKTSLSVMSFHTRLAQIGRNKPKRSRENASVAGGYASPRSAPAGGLPNTGELNDEIPFAPEMR